MKKRTKTILALSTALCMSFGFGAFAACNDGETPEPGEHTHVDVDPQDGKCDVCGNEMSPSGKTFSVTFDTDGGIDVPAQGVKSGEKAVKPADPTKPGAVFDGWYKDENCTEAFSFDDPITADTVVYAKWKAAEATSSDLFNAVTLEDGTVSISAKPNSTLPQDTVLPEKLDGKDVTAIAPNAFEGQKLIKSVTIPASVKIIGERAFFNASALEVISGAENVETLGGSALAGTAYDSNLPVGEAYIGKVLYKYAGSMYTDTNIQIKDGTVSIAGQAFMGLEKLVGVTLPSTLREIGNYAFGGTAKGTGLTEIVLPDSVETVGANAFSNSKALASVTFGKGLKSVGNKAFSGTAVTTVVYNAVEATFASEAFTGFTAEATLTIGDDAVSLPVNLTKGWTGLKTVTVGAKVTEIPDSMFSNLSNLETVTISGELVKIGNYAFRGTKLTEVEIPATVTSVGGGAYANCKQLASVEFSANSPAMGVGVFSGCENLKTVSFGSGVTQVPDSLFEGISTITAVSSWGGVTKIGANAFYGTGLTAVTLPDELTEIGANAFYGTGLTEVSLPDGLEIIGEGAFSGTKLTAVTIPLGVTELGASAFANISTLTRLTFNAAECVSTGGASAFAGSNIETVSFGPNVTAIPARLLEGNTHISEITIPTATKQVGDYAFNRCSALETVTGIDGVQVVGTSAFGETPFLGNYLAEAEGYVYLGQILYAYRGAAPEDGKLVVREGTVSIGANAVTGRTDITSIQFPTTVTSVGDHAFDGCSKLAGSIDISNLTEIGEGAFKGCSSLSFGDVTFKKLAKLGKEALSGCTLLTGVTMEEGCTVASIPQSALYATGATKFAFSSSVERFEDYCFNLPYFDPMGKITYVGGDVSKVTSITAPGLKYVGAYTLVGLNCEVDFSKVEAFGAHALTKTKLTHLTLGENLTSIPAEFIGSLPAKNEKVAAEASTTLEEVDLSACKKLTSIGDYAFRNCTALKTVKMPAGEGTEDTNIALGIYSFTICPKLSTFDFSNVSSIGEVAFKETALTALNFSSKLHVLQDNAFYAVTTIRGTVELSGNFEEQVGQAFASCTGIQKVIIHSGAKTLYSTFSSCVGITEVVIDDGVKALTGGTFANVTKANFDIPASVTTITGSAFGACMYVTLHSEASAITTDTSAFAAVKAIRVPADVYQSYQTSGNWTAYKNKTFQEDWTDENGFVVDGSGKLLSYVGGSSMELKSTVTSVAEGAIPNSVSEISTANNSNFTAKENVLYDKDSKQLIRFAAGQATTEFTVPATVESILAGAFNGATKLTSVTLTGDKLPTLAAGVFDGLTELLIHVPESKGDAFRQAENWKQYAYQIVAQGEQEPEWVVNASGQLTKWRKPADFNGTLVLPAQLNGKDVTGFTATVFNDYESLPEVKKIEVSREFTFNSTAMKKLTAVEEVIYKAGSNTRTSSQGMFTSVPAKKVTFAGDALNLTTIPQALFYNMKTLQEIELPESVTVIGEQAFRGCTALTSIDLTGVITIKQNAFRGTGLTELTLPESLVAMEDWAFDESKSLTKLTYKATTENPNFGNTSLVVGSSEGMTVTIADGVKVVPKSLFSGSSNLTTLNPLPDSIIEIGNGAFSSSKLVFTATKLPANLQKMGNNCFGGTPVFTLTALPEGLKYMGNNAFGNSADVTFDFTGKTLNKELVETSLTGFGKSSGVAEKVTGVVTLPEGLEKIGALFSGTAITSIANLKTSQITALGANCFKKCTALTAIELPATCVETGNSALSGVNVTSIDLSHVSKLGDYLLQDSKQLTQVTLPENPETIGTSLLSGCESLADVTIPAQWTKLPASFYAGTAVKSVTLGANIAEIGGSLFNGCTKLTTFSMGESKVASIGMYTFQNCSELVNITLNNNLTSIGMYAFRGCSALQEIAIPSGVVLTGTGYFYDCTNLTKVNYQGPVGAKSDASFLYYNCTSLVNAVIPEGITSLSSVFTNCSALETIEIPATVTTIKGTPWDAKSGANLKSVTIKATTPPTIGSSAKINVGENTVIYVPESALTAYKQDTVWGTLNIQAIAS